MKNILLFLLLTSSFISAQEANILFNRINMAVYNPAFTGANGSFVSLNNRSQWSRIKDAPRTNYLIYNLPKSEKVALGFTAQNDQVFIENKTYFTTDYSYQLQVSTDQFFYLGLKGGGFYNNIDVNRLKRIYVTYNPALEPVSSYFTPILGLGIRYQSPNYFIGIGIPSLFDNKRFQDNNGWETTASDLVYLYYSFGSTIYLNEDFNFEPVLIYRALPNSPNLLSTTFAFNFKEQFSIGGGYANNNNIAFFITSKNLNGIEWGYGYEVMNRTEATAIQGGTHELMLRFIIGNKSNTSKNQTKRKEGYNER